MKEDMEQWKPVQTSHSDVCSPINMVGVSYRDVFRNGYSIAMDWNEECSEIISAKDDVCPAL